MRLLLYFLVLMFWYFSCNRNSHILDEPGELPATQGKNFGVDTIEISAAKPLPPAIIITQNATPDSVVAFAKTLIGVPYLYASSDPAQGFDCSGFITYVFNRFKIKVPRSSVDFTNVGEEIDRAVSKPGDLILFTGTESTVHVVGHMGIITDNTDSLRFIHSTSGKKFGVTITSVNKYYERRFVKVIRIF
ncbi:MAG: C40 family peptidase [Gloeobacteraceae cyanobacterium ES-bin-316]|nr:C40 family peptidase [Ferruginibacter sp.]